MKLCRMCFDHCYFPGCLRSIPQNSHLQATCVKFKIRIVSTITMMPFISHPFSKICNLMCKLNSYIGIIKGLLGCFGSPNFLFVKKSFDINDFFSLNSKVNRFMYFRSAFIIYLNTGFSPTLS
jgi:hypothetical protein